MPLQVLDKKKGTTAYKILEYINQFGEEGVPVGEIRRFLMEKIKGVEYDPVQHRGYWNTNLYGTGFTKGLFYYYCEQVPESKKWRLNAETRAFFETKAEELVKYSQHNRETVRDIAKRNPNFPQDLEGWAMNIDDWT